MMEGLYSDIYKLRMLIKSELMCNLKPSDCHTGEKSICATVNRLRQSKGILNENSIVI